MFEFKSTFPEDRRTFKSAEELSAWIALEEQGWSWLLTESGLNPWGIRLRETVQRNVGSLKNSAEQLQNPDCSDDLRRQSVAATHDRLNDWFLKIGFSSSSVFGAYLQAIAKLDRNLAAGAGWALKNDPSSENRGGLTSQAAEMAAVVALFKLGIDLKKLEAAEVQSNERSKVDWSETLNVVRKNWQDTLDSAQAELQALREAVISQADEFAKVFKDSQERLANHEKFMNEKLILQSPVRHWVKQANQCRRNAWLFGIAFLVSLCLAGIFVSLVITKFAIPRIETANGQNYFWLASVILIAGGAAAWPVRIFAKIMMSNIHLSTDATERAVLAKTYLALLRRNKDTELNAEERAVILSSLFRSASTGIVKEDGAPTSSIELLSRLLK